MLICSSVGLIVLVIFMQIGLDELFFHLSILFLVSFVLSYLIQTHSIIQLSCSEQTCTEPHFEESRLSLLDQGFIYAIAHIRGGGEMGRKW